MSEIRPKNNCNPIHKNSNVHLYFISIFSMVWKLLNNLKATTSIEKLKFDVWFDSIQIQTRNYISKIFALPKSIISVLILINLLNYFNLKIFHLFVCLKKCFWSCNFFIVRWFFLFFYWLLEIMEEIAFQFILEFDKKLSIQLNSE